MQIELTKASYSYQAGSPFAIEALHDIDLTIAAGELVAIIGHSGSGKSTLAQLLAGLILPTSGSVLIDGAKPAKGGVFRQVGLVFQYPEQQLFGETILEEVAFGAKNYGASEQELASIVDNALTEVDLSPQLFIERSPFSLSGGQKRRVAIASILAINPEIMILDEPTAGLDQRGRRWIIDLVKRLRERQGKTVIWISHNMEEVAELAQRIIVLSKGQKILDGDPHQVFAAEQQLLDSGLDIPQPAQLVRRLRKRGIPLPAQAITVGEASREISAWLGGDGNV